MSARTGVFGWRLSRRDAALLVVSVLLASLFIRLGLWQLGRLRERREQNARVAARLSQPPVPVRDLPRDTGAAHFRAVRVHGAYDYAHEFVLVERSRNGSPGVNIVTPVRLPGTDTAVLVNRGWVYSPDGVRVDLAPWREGDSVRATGYVVPFRTRAGSPALRSHPRAYRWLDPVTLRRVIPYPVRPVAVVLEGDSAPRGHVPPRVPPPPLDEGPHQSYAIQWFSFALIALVGPVLFLVHTRRDRDGADPPAWRV